MTRLHAYLLSFGLIVAVSAVAAALGAYGYFISCVVVFFAGLIVVAAAHNVPIAVGRSDKHAASMLLQRRGSGLRKPSDFEAQVDFILNVQDAVISTAPLTSPGIPLNQPREVSHLINSEGAMCFDRSRSIETILRVAGFKVRHLNVYSIRPGHSALQSVIHPDDGTASHSVSEVLTARGWMLVDSNFRYVGLTSGGEVFGIAYLQSNPEVRLHPRFEEDMPAKLRKRFTWVYGLYSRHGRFYPPYGAFPDVNWRELLYNISA